MSRQIIKKDNGKYAIWSTIVDNFIYDDITKKEYIEIRLREEQVKIEEDLKEIFEAIDGGKPEKIYFQFALSYKEAIKLRKEIKT